MPVHETVCNSIYREAPGRNHLCILPKEHECDHQCWDLRCPSWTEAQASGRAPVVMSGRGGNQPRPRRLAA